MKNLNHKGFALVETLIVSVFVMGIFTLLYTNYYPLIGEYEKRENYDSIEVVYRTDVLKRFIKKNGTNDDSDFSNLNGNYGHIYPYINKDKFCNKINNFNECIKLWENLKINSIVLTNYNISGAKSSIRTASENDITKGMKDYVDYLPTYKGENKYNYKGRIIVEYKETIDETNESYVVYKYATLGVDLYD